jgi:hypothetical protein
MSLDCLAHRLLILEPERAQCVGQRDPHRARVDPSGHRFREPVEKRQPDVHPRHLVPTDPGNRHRSQTLIVPQRMHHLGLVHGREGARWTIGLQQGDLLFHA